MNFDFSEEQKLLQKTARDYLEEHAPLTTARAVLESSTVYDADLWKAVAELGWLGTAVPEEYGGAGFGYLELALLAGEIGRALAPIPFGPSVCLASEAILQAGSPEQRKSYLPRLVSGDLIGTFACAEKPGAVSPAALATTFRNGRLSGTKIAVLDGDAAGLAVVAALDDGGVALALADLSANGVTRRAVDSIDPSRPVAQITFAEVPAEPLGPAGEGWALAERLLDRAAVLVAFEQLGGADRAFELTRDFAMGRYAFGRPVASFQAVKHRLADLYVELELARSHAYYGAWALSNEAPELPVAACGARIAATEAFELSAAENIQLHGGVGFTWEYDCHLFYRRSKLLALALGSAREWRERLVRRLATAPAA